MAYYSALIAAWNSTTQPPAGVLGTGLNATMTTQQKLTAVNGWTITGVVPTTIFVSGTQVLNAINWSEFNAIATAAVQANILTMCATPGQLLGGSANTTAMLPGILLANFTVGSKTIAALTALAQATVTPWWEASVANGGGGLTSPVNTNDLALAGGLT